MTIILFIIDFGHALKDNADNIIFSNISLFLTQIMIMAVIPYHIQMRGQVSIYFTIFHSSENEQD